VNLVSRLRVSESAWAYNGSVLAVFAKEPSIQVQLFSRWGSGAPEFRQFISPARRFSAPTTESQLKANDFTFWRRR